MFSIWDTLNTLPIIWEPIYRTEVPGSIVINLGYDVIDVLHTRLDSLPTADQLVLSSK